ncbi:M14 family metallopeptidase [Jeotgalibacillus soli]|nr:M14 family metallopeptidase [Jeotgalibacillus soli]
MVTMEVYKKYFATNYEESRAAFRSHLEKIKELWPDAQLTTEKIGQEKDNTIDMIYSEARTTNDQVLFFTSGEHGIEGYTGAAVIHLFTDEYLSKLNPETTGICLIHALNPWGMRHFRRVTENNVDLNRNYFLDRSSVPVDVNKHYENEAALFLPAGKITSLKAEKKKLHAQLVKALAAEGYSGITEAKGMGQFQFEKGVYYGGAFEEDSAIFLKKVQKKLLQTFQRIIHMDWHTALGPSNEITMVMSEIDSREAEEMKDKYGLKNIQKFSPHDVKGDSTNYFHEIKNQDFPERYLFSALFEFGTFGTDKKAELREFMTIILENHLYWDGAENEDDIENILNEFRAMFYPVDKKWLQDVVKQARLGIEGVLRGEELL